MFSLWTLCVLLRRSADAVAFVLKQHLLASFDADGFDDQSVPVLGDASSVSLESSLLVAEVPPGGSLITQLLDGVVRGKVWTGLMNPPSVLMTSPAATCECYLEEICDNYSRMECLDFY